MDKLPFNIEAPTDNRPFFFNMIRLEDFFRKNETERKSDGGYILGTLLLFVAGLTTLCFLIPFLLTFRKQSIKGSSPYFVYFASIGMAFMMIEISQMQRLTLFLGHPTYGLTVVLFALLVSTALGSQLTERIAPYSKTSGMCLLALIGTLITIGTLTPYIVHRFESAQMVTRMILSAGLLFPIGIFMGMAFPLGMKNASNNYPSLTPWLWAFNGATSVCASVLAVGVAIYFGISASFIAGIAFYGIAYLSFLRMIERARLPA